MLLVQIQVKTTARTEERITDTSSNTVIKGNANFSKATLLFCG
jgi:hypothetical protein